MRSGFSSIPWSRRAAAFALSLLALGVLLAPLAPIGVRTASPAVISDFPLYASLTPDDVLYPLQWGLPHVNAPQAWDVTLGSRNIVVAVVDTGVWWIHQDIQANMWTNTDGTHGFDFIDGDTNPMDEDVAGGTYHGTGVAGVIAALTNNRADVAGAAQVSVMALRALGSNGQGSSTNTSDAIRWAARNGAKVINLSLGTNDTFGVPTDLQLAINEAFRLGALVVAAAGNSGTNQLDYPARLANVVSVAALEQAGSRAPYSNYGPGLDLVAPGDQILTLRANDGTHYLSGTSLATPFVSAAAALLWSLEPSLTNVEVWNILNATADPIGSRYNSDYGWGEVDYWAALNALQRPFISVNSFPSRVARSSAITVGWSILGPPGLPVTDTHVEYGTMSGTLGNATAAKSGMTRDTFTDGSLRMPEGASALYFRVVADVTVNGTTQSFVSEERVITVSGLPEFVQILYELLSSNLLYLAIFVLALAAIVAFLPQRRARRRRAVAYHLRGATPPAYQVNSPPPGPPAGPPVSHPTHSTQAPAAYPPHPSPPAPAYPAERPVTPAPVAATPAAPEKKRCPSCGTMVNADNLFCFFCGQPFR